MIATDRAVDRGPSKALSVSDDVDLRHRRPSRAPALTTFISCGADAGSTSFAPDTPRTTESPLKYDPTARALPIPSAIAIATPAPEALPVTAYPMLKPSAPKRATTISASRNDLRLLSAIWL